MSRWARLLTFRRPLAADLAEWSLAKEAIEMSVDGPEVRDLLGRVERLERQNRLLKQAGLVLLCSPVARFAPLSEAIDLDNVHGVKMRPEAPGNIWCLDSTVSLVTGSNAEQKT